MRYYFAPMEGVTGWLFRQAHRHWFSGVDRYFMPFLSPRQEHAFTRREASDFLPEHNRGLYAVPQLLTRSADDFLWAAGVLADLGYREVNLNLGCPSGTVVAKGKGSGLLGRREELERLLDGIYARAGIPVSIKTRLGLRDPEEFFPLLELFNRYPVCELIIHPRVQKDFYRNQPRLDAFAAALASCRAPVCYNGDLVTAGGLRRPDPALSRRNGPDGGRGAVADPALFSKARGGPGADRGAAARLPRRTLRGLCAGLRQPPQRHPADEGILVLSAGPVSGRGGQAKALRKAADPAAYEAAVNHIFQSLPLREDAAVIW